MKKLLELAGMGIVGGIALTLLAVMLMAQTAPKGGSFTLTNSSDCITPALGVFSFCKPTAGGPVQWTDEGSGYAVVNLSGTPGPQGPAGPKGATGAPGVAGPAGAQGPAGVAGAQGPIGLTGPQGVQGIPGATGPTGVPGVQGPQGVAGPQGPPGTISGPVCVAFSTNAAGQTVLTPITCK